MSSFIITTTSRMSVASVGLRVCKPATFSSAFALVFGKAPLPSAPKKQLLLTLQPHKEGSAPARPVFSPRKREASRSIELEQVKHVKRAKLVDGPKTVSAISTVSTVSAKVNLSRDELNAMFILAVHSSLQYFAYINQAAPHLFALAQTQTHSLSDKGMLVKIKTGSANAQRLDSINQDAFPDCGGPEMVSPHASHPPRRRDGYRLHGGSAFDQHQFPTAVT